MKVIEIISSQNPLCSFDFFFQNQVR